MSGILPQIPSGSPASGRMVKVVATGTLGTTLHTAVSGSTNWDSITIYACNNDTVSRDLTIEFGGAVVGDQIVHTLAAKEGLKMVCPAMRLNGALVVTAFATAANVVNCYVEVDRITV